ncbi:Urease accessory protein UreF [Rubellimicrobium mesophilum DSM 19309]|uniref:Urease accessory protein UreF n=1 Tax=Rubellimicrobium mesophilum DSM 19309 TaxID=442562 RepID=A0A017HFI0_9RHOB|nr:urease accessory UreF family protein [Rubellimicrobium mesophilum]EYD72928.1 Urease accessory protein UreF [Rubellimicrobium mesophilum DSM 19309]
MEAEALLTLAQWLSPAYPTGAFAWSHGLEAATAQGLVRDAAGLEGWIADLLTHGSGRTDAILLGEAFRADPATLAGLDDLALALAPSYERLAETREQGAAFAAVTRAVRGFDLPDMALPLAVGRAAALAGVPLRPVVQLYLQGLASTQIQAALRLMPLGQTAGQCVLHRLAPLCARVAEESLSLTTEDIGPCALGLDLAAMRHETLPSRIFRS